MEGVDVMDFSLKHEDYLKKLSCGKYIVIKEIPYSLRFSGNGTIPVGFTTDICTAVPNGDWWLSCVLHDALYVRAANSGKSIWEKAVMRSHADMDLAWGITMESKIPYRDMVAAFYYLGVRIFGLPVFWRPGKHE